jgi:hypothetical protein
MEAHGTEHKSPRGTAVRAVPRHPLELTKRPHGYEVPLRLEMATPPQRLAGETTPGRLFIGQHHRASPGGADLRS